jgi:dUTP pyrophosphatase
MFPDVKFMRVNKKAAKPSYAYSWDAGMDLSSMEDVIIAPGETVVVGTGIAIAIPDGFFGDLRPRSSTATKRFVTLANTPAVIDSGYRGEILLPLHNMKRYEPVHIEEGERVAQLLILPVAHAYLTEVESLDETERGTRGFGSSGRL